ncbi:MAG: hypothetical protein QM730_28310 [Anaerolineales bacterium]
MLSILTLISYIMIAILLMNMMAKARPRVKEAIPGKKLKSLPMSLISRFQLQRSSLLALLVGVVFGASTGWLSLSTAGIVATLALLTLLIPMQYTFTTQGVALGDGMFYPWKGFTGFIADKRQVELTHPSFFGRLTLFIKPAEMPNVLETVERFVKTNKK